MTRCVSGGMSHPFPIEDESGAYCPVHEVTLLWHPISTDAGIREDGALLDEPTQPPGQQLSAR